MPVHTLTNEQGETLTAYCGMCHQPLAVFREQGEEPPTIDHSHDKWDIQRDWNPWFSLGIHIDHKHGYVSIHLPGILFSVGLLSSPPLGVWSLRKWDSGE